MENLTTVARLVVTPEQRVGGTDYLSEVKLILLEDERVQGALILRGTNEFT